MTDTVTAVPPRRSPRTFVAPTTVASTAVHTDAYEITMLRAALADGTAAHRAAFEVFARGLPAGRRYGVVAGLGRLTEALREFRFTDAQIAMLRATGGVFVLDEYNDRPQLMELTQ